MSKGHSPPDFLSPGGAGSATTLLLLLTTAVFRQTRTWRRRSWRGCVGQSHNCDGTPFLTLSMTQCTA